jgi:hypothetical protein
MTRLYARAASRVAGLTTTAMGMLGTVPSLKPSMATVVHSSPLKIGTTLRMSTTTARTSFSASKPATVSRSSRKPSGDTSPRTPTKSSSPWCRDLMAICVPVFMVEVNSGTECHNLVALTPAGRVFIVSR